MTQYNAKNNSYLEPQIVKNIAHSLITLKTEPMCQLHKQGFVEGYSQRLIEGNIVRQKLSRLKVSRLRPHRLRLVTEAHGLRLYRLKLYGSDAGGGGGVGSRLNYILLYES